MAAGPRLCVELKIMFIFIPAACRIRVNGDIGAVETQPLYIVPNTNQFLSPNDRFGNIDLAAGQSVEFHCSAGFSSTVFTTNSIIGQCVSGTTYSVNGVNRQLSLLRCNDYAAHIARRTTGRCFNNAILAEIGFNVGTRFLRIMEVCHDEVNDRTHYVRHEFTPGNAGFQQSTPRPSFIQGDFFRGRNVNQLYTLAVQRRTIASILNSQARADYLVQDNASERFLARGHITARADFIFGAQQRASFYYINAAPQWQAFNGGNWERIETGTRSFVGNRNIVVDVYSGTFGVGRAADGNGVQRELFLDSNPNGLSRIPVPAIFYKVLHNRANNSGIVFIGVNDINTNLADIRNFYTFCNDVSHLINWIGWDRQNIAVGYSYACEFNDFSRNVPHLAHLTITSLLV